MRMKLSIILLSVLALSSSVCAQTPEVGWLYVDEPSRTLFVHGSGFGDSTVGAVTVDSVSMVPTKWSDTLVTCLLPDSGRGYAGPVQVYSNAIRSNKRVLSESNFKVTFDYSQQVNEPASSFGDSSVWNLRFRLDFLNATDRYPSRWPTRIQPSRASTSLYYYNGGESYSFDHSGQPTWSMGYGEPSWAPFDSSGSIFCGLAQQDTAMSMSIIKLILRGSFVRHYSKCPTEVKALVFSITDMVLHFDNSMRLPDTDSDFYPNGNSDHNISRTGHIRLSEDRSIFLPSQGSDAVRKNISSSSAMTLYPNPSNSKSILSLDLTSAQHINAQLFDPLGRKVLDIWNGIRSAGKNELTFDASTLPEGVYYCQIDFGGERALLKMVHTQ
jgi:hypothetical protein